MRSRNFGNSPPDPVLEAVAASAYPQNREWKGSPAELAQFAQPDMAANRLNKHLNVNAGRLLEENKGVTIRYLPVRRVL